MSFIRACFVLLLCAALLPTPSSTAQQGEGFVYELHIACPDETGVSFDTGSGVYACPVRVVDDADMMGDPSLAVDPLDPKNLIIGSLHGLVDGEGPTTKSRSNERTPSLGIFTTFTSDDSGASWFDRPYPPASGVPGDSFAEHPQVTIDPYGQLYIGSLYAAPTGDGFRSLLVAQKFESLYTIREQGQGRGENYNAEFIDPVYKDSRIGQFWFLFNPRTDNMTIVWHELPQQFINTTATPPPNCLLGPPAPCVEPPTASGATAPPATTGRHGAREARAAPDNATAPAGRGVIGVVWTSVDANGTYERQPIADAIGPCSSSTNPVLSDGFLYVGCVADPTQGEFVWNPATLPGTVELFRMNPDGGKPQYLGASPVVGGAPKLGVRSDGRLALVSAQGTTEGALGLSAVFGHYTPGLGRIEWSSVLAYGDKVTKPDPSERVLRANVQDLIYREYSGVIHMVLRETVEASGVGVGALVKELAPHIRKSVVAIDEGRGVLAKFPLDIGNPLNRTDSVLLQAPEMAYEDLSDDFLQLPPGPFNYNNKPLGDSYQREFFAVGDYGTVIFAELIEVTDLRGPGVPIVPANPSPIASAATSLNLNVAGIAAVAVVGLLATLLALNRRKNPAAAMAKRGK